MTEERINAYEGLFLFPQTIGGDLQAAIDHIKEILAKSDVQLISLQKWDERRLAYEIKGNKRGVYFLVYFRAARTALASIERSCNLSELLLRFMIVRADQLTQEQMESVDGTAELADEIKLRAEQEATRTETPSAAVVSRPGDVTRRDAAQAIPAEAETVPIKTEPATKDAATT